MTSKTLENGGFQRIGWVIGGVSLLFIVGAGGLELFARQAYGQVSVATLLLTLYLASWTYVLGLVGLVLLSVWWLVGWRRVRVTRAAMSQYTLAEPRNRRLDKPPLEEPQFPQQGVAPVVPSRSSRDSGAGNVAASPSRVA